MRRVIAVVMGVLLPAGMAGCKATPPGKLEASTMSFVKHRIVIGNKKQKNPLPDNKETREDGQEAFSHYCVACHGMDGQNTGVPFANRVSPPIPSLGSPEVQSYTDGQLKWILDNGIWPSGMPASKGMLSDDELWSIVVYLRHLPPAGSQGVPQIYAQ